MTKELEKRSALRVKRIHWVAGSLLLMLSIGAWFVFKPTANNQLPTKIFAQADFPIYYYPSSSIPQGFSLDRNSVKFSAQALFFTLHNGKQTITITEQSLPNTFSAAKYPNAEKVSGADGEAIINYNGTRPVGALFGKGQSDSQTLVLLNSNDQVQNETMRDMLRRFRIIKH